MGSPVMAEGLDPTAGESEQKQKKRRRAKRPGVKRTSKMKRERRTRARQKHDPPEELQDSRQRERSSDKDGDVAGKTGKRREKKDSTISGKGVTDGVKKQRLTQNRVIIKGLPNTVDEQLLLEEFRVCGQIVDVKLNRNTRGEFRGSAFIAFKNESGVTSALARDGCECAGETIMVQKATPPAPKLQVYVGRLHYEADKETLHKDFGECGEITNLRMLQDKSSGKFKGVVFVTYADQAGVDAALKYDGTIYSGRKICVRLSDASKGEDAGN